MYNTNPMNLPVFISGGVYYSTGMAWDGVDSHQVVKIKWMIFYKKVSLAHNQVHTLTII